MQGFRSRITSRLFWPITLLLLGCSGDASTPDPGDGLPACSLGKTMVEIETKLFQGDKCKTCHVRTASGMLPLYPTTFDIGSPGLAMRVVDQMAEPGAKGKCAGRVLLPKSDPLNSLFVEKVEADRPSCGDRMPQALPRLNADEVSCVKRWAVMAAMSAP